MSWTTTTIGEVCEVVSGATPKSNNPSYWDGEVAWVSPKDLSNLDKKYLEDTPRKITNEGFRSCSAKMLPEKSVLFSSRAPIGLVAINNITVCTNQGFKSMVPKSNKIFTDYLYWWLKIHRKAIEQLGRGATFKEVSKKIVEGITIPLPPLEEQKRIAGILDAADALRAKRREALEQLDQLAQSTFLDMFGDPVTNPKGWDVVNIRDIGEVITGNTPSRNRNDYYGDAIEWIKSDNINDPSFKLTNAKEGLSNEGKKVGRTAPSGAILVTCIAGSKSCIGNAAIADREVAFNQQINALVPNNLVESWYVLILFFVGKSIIQGASTNSMKGMVSKSSFLQIKLPLPPISLQKEFASIIESIEKQKEWVKAHLQELDTLFSSLQSRAFKGEL